MKNIKYKLDKKFLKIQERMEDTKDVSNFNKDINEAELEKTNIFLEMGQLLYTKIRTNKIKDVDFEEYCNKLLELDKSIYDNNIKVGELKESKLDKICECGHIIDNNYKFCSECGKRVDIELNKDKTKVCILCGSDIPLDCDYCICCGNKVEDTNI